MDSQSGDRQWTYRITVQGRLDGSWSNWFSGLAVVVEGPDDEVPITHLSGPVVDQPALRGILNKLWDLNLTLVSVKRVAMDPSGEETKQ